MRRAPKNSPNSLLEARFLLECSTLGDRGRVDEGGVGADRVQCHLYPLEATKASA